MKDFAKFIDNRSYTCIADSFGPLRPEQINADRYNPILANTGAFLQPNGDIKFNIFNPKANSLEIDMMCGHSSETLVLKKNSEGFFEGIFPYTGDSKWTGKRNIRIRVDGTSTVNPRIPFFFRGGKITNYIDMPDTEWDDYLIKKVPHGTLAYEIYWSEIVGDWQRCMVYTPAEYRHNVNKKYPVMYLHHGGGENETTWMFGAKVPQIMDNLIAEDKAEPFIVVTTACSPRLPSDGTHGMDGYSGVLLKECIPFIEREYRVKADKWNRAIAGNSYGCMISSFLGFSHPEIFGNLGLISGTIRCRDTAPKLEDNHHLDWLCDNAEKVIKEYKLIYRSHGDVEYYDFPDHVEETEFLKEKGIDVLPCFVREFYPGGRHEWDMFGKEFAAFAKLLFKD